MRLFIRASLLFLLFCSPAFAEPSSEIAPIRIGVLTDLSGKFSYWGNQTVVGVELVKKQLSTRGIPVEFIIEDSGLDPARAATATHRLIDIEKVDAVYSEGSPPSVAASPIVNKAGKLFFYIALADSIWSGNTLSVKSYLEADVGCKKVADYWNSFGIKSVGMLKATAEFSELCARGLRQTYPNLKIIDYNPGDELNTPILSFKKHGIEAIVNVGYEPDALRVYKALAQLHYVPWVSSSHIAMTNNVLAQMSFEQRKKVITYSLPRIPDDFLQQVKTIDPGNSLISIEGAAYAFVHLPQIAQALHACHKQESAEKKSRCAISELEKSSADKILGFSKFRDRRAQLTTVLNRWENGKPQQIYLR